MLHLCHYPEKYDDLLDEIHQKKQSTVLEKLERISILIEYVGDVTMNETMI